jgi:hypothetical protein
MTKPQDFRENRRDGCLVTALRFRTEGFLVSLSATGIKMHLSTAQNGF